MRISIINLSVLIVIIFIILISLPPIWHAKVVGTIAAMSFVLFAYGIYITNLDYEDNLINQSNPANYISFIELQNMLVSNDKLKDIYKEIYGSKFDADKHNAITLMAIRIQEANDFYGISSQTTLPENNPIINVLKSWTNTKTFKEIWPSIKKYYKPETDKFITMLQSNP